LKVPLPIEKIEYLYQIGQGEKEAIALSLDDKESLLLTDDGGAIKIAKYLQKSFIISPVIAVDLYQLGFISFDEAKRAIEKLNTIGRYLPNLIADVFIMLESVRSC
jgi:predicted nucleic acid-binding protein